MYPLSISPALSPDKAGLFVSDPSARALRDANESAGKLTMTTLTAAKKPF
jgi:hypothetical protein